MEEALLFVWSVVFENQNKKTTQVLQVVERWMDNTHTTAVASVASASAAAPVSLKDHRYHHLLVELARKLVRELLKKAAV